MARIRKSQQAPISTRPLPAERPRLAVDGGTPVRHAPRPTYDKGAVFVSPDDEAAALRAIRSHLYFRYDCRAQQDTECGQLEDELSAYFGTRHALAVSSGTTALALALMAAQVPPGSLVACPGFTFVATPSAIVLAGCRPLLVEVDENLHLDVADLRRRCQPEIRAIMVVHMRGFAGDLGALTRFAAEMGVPLIEDAVPAPGAELGGRKLGTFGRAGAFSTQSDKALNCGEGGFLVTDDSALFARAVVLSGAYEGRMRRHFPVHRGSRVDGVDRAARAPRPADRPLRGQHVGRDLRRHLPRGAAGAGRLRGGLGLQPGRAAGRAAAGQRPAVLPGTALGLAATGYAGLAAFVVLHLDARGSHSGVAVLTCFSAVYAGTRLVIGHLPDKLGPRRVATWSAAGEAVGLLIIAAAPNLPV